MGKKDDVVDIELQMHANTDSARKAGKQMSDAVNAEINSKKRLDELSDEEYNSEQRLLKLQRSKNALEKNFEKILKEEGKYVGKRSKADKESLDALTKKASINADKQLDRKFEIEAEEEKLRKIREEIEAIRSRRQVEAQSFSEELKESKAREGLIKEGQRMTLSANRAMQLADEQLANKAENTHNRIRTTAKQMQENVKNIMSTLGNRPSDAFSREDNKRIADTRKQLASLLAESQEIEKQFDKPFKVQVDIQQARRDLARVKDDIKEQTVIVDKLKNNYDYAVSKASKMSDNIKSGAYTEKELAAQSVQLKEANKFANESYQAYKQAESELQRLQQEQNRLTASIDTSTQSYNNMVTELKKDSSTEQYVETNENAVAQYTELNEQIISVENNLRQIYNEANDNSIIKQDDVESARIIREELEGIGNEVRNIQETGTVTGYTESAKQYVEWYRKALIASKQMLQQEISDARQRTSTTYYRLRSIKMLSASLESAKKSMDAFGKKAISVFNNVAKSVLKLGVGFGTLPKNLRGATSHLTKFDKAQKKLTKSTKNYNFTLKDLIKNILKYGLGIRSLYVLFNKLRRAIVDGIKNLVQGYDAVNKQMSSIATSLLMMKNAVAAAVQPLLNVLAPALEKLSAILSEVAYKVASFIATLTGQKTVYRAIRYQVDYAESLDKTSKSAEKANKELSNLDKLNVLKSDDKNDTPDYSKMFEEVPIDKTMADWAKKFKDFFKKLFKPIKAAWDKEGAFVMKAWKYALQEIKGLMSDIARDFWKVWEEPETQRIFENIFHILGDIGLIVGHLARNFRKAWNANDNGYRILKAIRDIILTITEYLRKAADATVKWADKLDFVPLLTAIADVLSEQVLYAVDRICNLALTLYTKFVLPFAKHFVESTLPKLIRAVGNIVEAIGHIANNIDKALKRGNMATKIANSIMRMVDTIADGLLDCTKYTKEWAKQLKFYKLVEAIKDFLLDCEPTLKSIVGLVSDLYKNILLPLVKYVIETALPNALNVLGTIVSTLGIIVDKVRTAFSENGNGERILASIQRIVEKIGGTIKNCADKTKEWSKNINFGPLVESIATFLEKAEKPIGFIVDTLGKFYTNVILPFRQYMIEEGLPKMLKLVGEIIDKVDWDKLTQKVNEFLKAFEPFLEKVWKTLLDILGDLGNAIANFVNSNAFEHIINFLIRFMNNTDPGRFATKLEIFAIAFLTFRGVIGGFTTALKGWQIAFTILNFFNNAKLATTIANNTAAIGGITTALNGLEQGAGAAAGAATASQTAATAAAGTATAAAGTAGQAAAAGASAEAAAGSAAAGASGAATAATAALGVFDAAIVAYDVGKLIKVHHDWNKADTEHEKAVNNYCSSIEKLYHAAGENAVKEITGSKDSIEQLQKQIEHSSGQHKADLELKYNELVKVYEKAGNEAVSTVAGTNTTLEQEQAKAKQEFEEMPHNMWQGFSKGWGEYFGMSKGVKGNVEGMGRLISDSFTEFINTGKSILGIKSNENGPSDEFKSMGDSAAEGFNSGFNDTWNTNEPGMVKSFDNLITEGNETLDINSPSKRTETMGINTAEGFFEGFTKQWNTFNIAKILSGFTDKLKKSLTSDTSKSIGRIFAKGLESGIKSGLSPISSTINKGVNDIKNKFRNGLKPNILNPVGKQLINGLKSGLMSGLNSALAAVTSICNKITGKARAAFAIHSPSKVFMKIGEQLVEGLIVGVDDDADNVEKSFESLVPSDDMLNEFYKRFMDMMSSLVRNVSIMFDEMIRSIDRKISSLSSLDSMYKLQHRLHDIDTRVPDIAQGYQLPSNVDFTQNLKIEMDFSKLPDIMKQAFIDAIKETADLQTEDETIIVNIDGKNIFQAVRSENTKYKKQHGVSAFA